MSDESERLRKARELAGFDTMADASERLGLEYSTYAGHENGSRGFDKDDARKYARHFKVNVLWLLYGLGEPRGRSVDQMLATADPQVRADIEGFIHYKLGLPAPEN